MKRHPTDTRGNEIGNTTYSLNYSLLERNVLLHIVMDQWLAEHSGKYQISFIHPKQIDLILALSIGPRSTSKFKPLYIHCRSLDSAIILFWYLSGGYYLGKPHINLSTYIHKEVHMLPQRCPEVNRTPWRNDALINESACLRPSSHSWHWYLVSTTYQCGHCFLYENEGRSC